MSEPSRRWLVIEGAAQAAFETLAHLPLEERKRIIERIRSGERPPKTYDQGWSEGRIFQEKLVILHLHARGFCEAAKALEQVGFYGSFGMAGSSHFGEEAFEKEHSCFKDRQP